MQADGTLLDSVSLLLIQKYTKQYPNVGSGGDVCRVEVEYVVPASCQKCSAIIWANV